MIRDSSAASFISLCEYGKNEKTAKLNIHNIIAIFTYEVNFFGTKKKRTIKSEKEIAEFLKENLTMNVAFALSGFFLKSYKGLLKATNDYLESQKVKEMKKIMKLKDHNL
jgi:hypothetical protein